jgi:hypothetical protein
MTRFSKLAAVLLVGMSITAMPVHAQTARATKSAYSVKETTLGVLLDDPVSKAIIARLVPTIIDHPQVQIARALTLVQLQGFAGDLLTDPVLGSIDTALRKAAPKR